MATSLKIEIESESKENTLELLKRVVAEITLGPAYQVSEEVEDNFIVVGGPFKGKYNWSLD